MFEWFTIRVKCPNINLYVVQRCRARTPVSRAFAFARAPARHDRAFARAMIALIVSSACAPIACVCMVSSMVFACIRAVVRGALADAMAPTTAAFAKRFSVSVIGGVGDDAFDDVRASGASAAVGGAPAAAASMRRGVWACGTPRRRIHRQRVDWARYERATGALAHDARVVRRR